MNFLFNYLSEFLTGTAQEAATYCAMLFSNQKMPKSLREEVKK